MRTTIQLDDELLARAQALAPDVKSRTELIHAGLEALIHLRASRALAELGGAAAGRAGPAPRRRPGTDAKAGDQP